MLTLIENGEVFAPRPLARQLAGGKLVVGEAFLHESVRSVTLAGKRTRRPA